MNKKEDVLIIRKIQKKDFSQLYHLLNDLSFKSKQFYHPHPFDRQTIREICYNKSDYYYVMRLNNILIGYSFLRLFGYKNPSFGCCIKRNYENMGYGTIITKWTVEKAKKLGFSKIILKVYKDNKRALHLYKKIGFVVYNTHSNCEEILMEYILK